MLLPSVGALIALRNMLEDRIEQNWAETPYPTIPIPQWRGTLQKNQIAEKMFSLNFELAQQISLQGLTLCIVSDIQREFGSHCNTRIETSGLRTSRR